MIHTYIICIVLTCAVYCRIAENIGSHKIWKVFIWKICHERHLAGFTFGRFRVPSADDVTKWLPSYLMWAFLLLFPTVKCLVALAGTFLVRNISGPSLCGYFSRTSHIDCTNVNTPIDANVRTSYNVCINCTSFLLTTQLESGNRRKRTTTWRSNPWPML